MTPDKFTADVRAFHVACGLPLDQPITDAPLLALRLALLDEELRELREAAEAARDHPTPANRAMMLRELADVQYVLSGFAASFGLPLAEAFDRVHTANLSKLVDGKPLKSETGKVLKGPNFAPPVLEDLVT